METLLIFPTTPGPLHKGLFHLLHLELIIISMISKVTSILDCNFHFHFPSVLSCALLTPMSKTQI